MTADSDAPKRLTPYQRLVRDTAAAQGLSYAEVARKSNGLLSRQRVQQIVTIPIRRTPDKDTIRGLAKGLGLNEDTIREAVSETLGLRVLRSAPSSEVSEIVDLVEQLPLADQERFLRLARGLLRDLREHPSGD